MTDDPPPPDETPKSKPPRGRPRKQKDIVEEAILSDEEVARRVDVRGGGTPRAPIERAPIRERHPISRRPERSGARDSLLLIGLVIVGLVAVRLFLPDGPLTASSTASPSGTQAAVLPTATPAPGTPAPTGGLITLPPTAVVPTDTPGPVTEPPVTEPPTAAPPTPTLRPGQTPKPTPKPTRTPGPTPPPGSPTMTVSVSVVNSHGGQSAPGDWTISVDGANAIPFSFPGSSNTLVTLSAGQAYQVSEDPQTSEAFGYTTVRSSQCGSSTSSTLAPGQHVTCTITKYDEQAYLTVVTDVNGGSAAATDWDVTVSGTNVTPSSPRAGSASGQPYRLDAHATFNVTIANGPADYDLTKVGSCSGSAVSGAHLTCTLREDYNPPPTDTPPPPTDTPPPPPIGIAAMVVLPAGWRARRWRSNPAG